GVVPRGAVAGGAVQRQAGRGAVQSELPAAERQHRRADAGERGEHGRGWRRIAANGGHPGPGDARLLDADAVAVVTQPGLVVEIDRSDYSDVRSDDIDRIEAATQADLEDRHLAAGLDK